MNYSKEALEARVEEIRRERKLPLNPSKQHATRRKHERIRCPLCNSISTVKKEYFLGYQIRECREGHEFRYDYTVEAIKQWVFNYKIKI
jgi:hypothetical protein